MSQIVTADFMRGIMVSAAALIMGFSATSTYLTATGKQLGRVYHVPPWVNFLFVIGYNILLISLITNRWNSIGQPISISSLIASIGLTLNVISVVCYAWYIKGEKN